MSDKILMNHTFKKACDSSNYSSLRIILVRRTITTAIVREFFMKSAIIRLFFKVQNFRNVGYF